MRTLACGLQRALMALKVRWPTRIYPVLTRHAHAMPCTHITLTGNDTSARRLQPATLSGAIAFEDKPQTMQGQMLIVMGLGMQFWQ